MTDRILWASPLPPIRSGISDYSVEILGPLSRMVDVKILTPPTADGRPNLPSDLERLLVPMDTQPEPDQLIVAHFGNNPYHQWILDRCHGDRVVAVVHDLVLHHLLVHQTLRVANNPDDFAEKLQTAHGKSGAALAQARALGLTGRMDPFLFPAFKAVLGEVKGLICHSEFSEKELKRELPDKPVLRMKLPGVDPGAVDRLKLRQKYGIKDSDVLMMHLGFLTPEKGLISILGGLAAARSAGVNARLLVVGEGSGNAEILAAAEHLGIESSVESTGWLTWEDMISIPSVADVGIVLRVPSAGETSAAVIRFIACGTPAAVIAQRQFLEWPPEISPRITPGPSMGAEIGRLLKQISENPEWNQRRSAARRAFENDHTLEKAAAALVGFLKTFD